MPFRENDAFRLDCYLGSGGESRRLDPAECHDAISGSTQTNLIFACTSTIAPFEDQPTRTDIVSGTKSQTAIVRQGSTRRLFIIGSLSLFVGSTALIAILYAFISEFSLDFLKSDWPIIPMGLLFFGFSGWFATHLLLRAKFPPQLSKQSGDAQTDWVLTTHPDWISIPTVHRRRFTPAFFFLTRIGIAISAEQTVEQTARKGIESLESLTFVLGICSKNGDWLCLQKSDDVRACRDYLDKITNGIPDMASVPVLDQPETSRLVWSCDDPEEGGMVTTKRFWATKS